MRVVVSLFLATATIAAINVTPVHARDYPYCIRGRTAGIGLDCRFTSFEQCRASTFGTGGSCLINPRVAHSRRRSQ